MAFLEKKYGIIINLMADDFNRSYWRLLATARQDGRSVNCFYGVNEVFLLL